MLVLFRLELFIQVGKFLAQRLSHAEVLIHSSSGPFVLALLSYALIRYAGSVLPLSEYSLFGAFWSLLMGIGVGLGFPLESYGQNLDLSDSASTQSILNAFWTYLIFLTAVFVIFLPILDNRIFDSNWSVVLALLISLICIGFIYLTRGMQLANHDAKSYSGFMGLESLLRIMISMVLFVYIWNSANAFIYGICFTAVIIGTFNLGYIFSHIKNKILRFPTFNIDFSYLVVANLIAFSILNLGPAIIKALEPLSSYSGIELNALTLTRSVIFAGPILQAIVMRTQKQNSISLSRILSSVTIALAIFCFFVSIYGVKILRIFFDKNIDYSQSNLLVLSLASSAYVLATIFQAKLITHGKFSLINNAWIAGLAVALLVLFVSSIDETVLKTEIAALVGICTAVLHMSSSLRTIRALG